MSIKKEKVNITYDAIWLKIFMDSDELSMYSKEVFVTKDIAGDKNIMSLPIKRNKQKYLKKI